MTGEVDNIIARYARRRELDENIYCPLKPDVYMARQERERALLRWIRKCRLAPVKSKKLLEIGCGSGANFLEFLRLGFRPENMVGNEILPERIRAAREVLPNNLLLLPGNALELDIPVGSYDIVLQSTLFTSILDSEFQSELAQRMWEWVAPGGGVLWYDFIYNNPHNHDVRGVPLAQIRRLFPEGHLRHWRLTLAPPISRSVTRIHPAIYRVFNAIPIFRTHVLCWICKNKA